jgi:glycosyltransferase involved in cell wall biosynthesis
MEEILKKVLVIIPAFNEAKAIGSVIDDVREAGYNEILVVDDGSLDNTSEVAKQKNCIVLRHKINRGKGAATQTGFDGAKLLDADFVVTIDADGQHSPKDIKNVLDPLLKEETDVVLGSRFKSDQQVPFSRIIANSIGNLLTFLFYGIYVSDSQSGFRGYNKKALNLIQTTFDRYEFESEIIDQINIHKLKYKEVPIIVSYSDYSKNKWNGLKGAVVPQTLMNGVNMFIRMLVRSITT